MGEDADDGGALADLDAWRDHVEGARIPTSAQQYAVDRLYGELRQAVLEGQPSPQQLAVTLRSEEGFDARGRALRILDRLGELQPAIDAVAAGQRARRLR